MFRPNKRAEAPSRTPARIGAALANSRLPHPCLLVGYLARVPIPRSDQQRLLGLEHGSGIAPQRLLVDFTPGAPLGVAAPEVADALHTRHAHVVAIVGIEVRYDGCGGDLGTADAARIFLHILRAPCPEQPDKQLSSFLWLVFPSSRPPGGPLALVDMGYGYSSGA